MFYKVMIVEDEDMIRNGLKFGFDWHAHNCVVVADTHSSKEAILMLEEYRPDIVLMDINLPIMSGLEIIEKTQEKYDYSSIIISGYSNFAYAQEAIELGVLRYLSKPIDHKDLEDGLKAAIKVQAQKRNKIKVESSKTYNLIEDYYQKGFKDEMVKDIIHFIEGNYQDKIQLKDLVEYTNYSESTINTRLKDILGTTFNQYLNQFRIHKAVEALEKDPNLNLQVLSSDVGIPNYKHFYQVFKKYTKYTPKQYVLNLRRELR